MSFYTDPERDQFDAFKALPRDEPVMMLNFLRFREKADYADGRDVSGAKAYAACGRESGPVFRRVGAEIVWRGRPELMLIGPRDKHWDLIFVARYPTAGAVLDSRLIRISEVGDGDDFAD